MPKTEMGFISTGGSIAKITFEIQNIQASGGPEFPKLVFPLEVKLAPFHNFSPGKDLIHPVSWMFISGELFSPQQRAVARFRDDVNIFADSSASHERQLRLEIPLDLMTVVRMEESREGDLWAGLKFNCFFAVHVSGAVGVQRFETGTTEPLYFSIPRSQWLERLLPQLGYGKLELIEVRISNGVRPEGLPKAVQEIRQARSYLAEGDWEKAVIHCRKTLETILDSRQLQIPAASRFALKVDTFIHDHLSSLSGGQAKLLAEEMKLLWEVCSSSAHPSPQDYFKRADAKFIVRNTTAILEYVGRLLT